MFGTKAGKIILYGIIFVIFYLIYFFIIVRVAEAEVCLVPEGVCATKGCATLAAEDKLDYPVSHTDGDASKISIMHQQSSPTSPVQLVLDVCYESTGGKEVGGYNIEITPTGLLAPTSCEWECDWTSEDCTGWHEMNRYTPRIILGSDCTSSYIESSYFSEDAGTSYPPPGYTTGNVILARITFSGSAKAAGLLNDTPPGYGITSGNIALPEIMERTEVDDYTDIDDIASTYYPLEVQTVWESLAAYPPTSGSITCVPADPSECPVSGGGSIDGVLTMSWAAPSPACDVPALCPTINYKVYRGGTKDGGGQPVAGCMNISSRNCSETVADAISEFPAAAGYYVYTNIPSVGDSVSYLNLNASCQCVPEFSLMPGWNLITLSVNPADGAASAIFAGNDVTLYSYDGGEFVGGDAPSFGTLSTGDAYWVYSELGVGGIPVSGADVVDATYEIPLEAGWNSFGSPYGDWMPWSDTNISVKDGAAAPVALSLATGLVNTTVYKFGTIEDGYVSVAANSGQMLAPWQGYWIKALKGCTLIISEP